MRNFQRKPKAFRPNRLFKERAQLREQALAIESERLSKVETLKTDPLEFFRQVLGVEPTDYQKELIESFLEESVYRCPLEPPVRQEFYDVGNFAQLCLS